MNLTPARKGQAAGGVPQAGTGVKLNHPEAVALITDFVVQGAGDGRCVAELMVVDEMDVQVAIHTDTMNESGFVEGTIAAEGILHDPGAFSMISSDSQAMGRVGEVIIRIWQTAYKMKRQPSPADSAAGAGCCRPRCCPWRRAASLFRAGDP